MPISPSFVSERDFWCSFGIVARQDVFLSIAKIFHGILQSVWYTSIWNLPFSNELLSNKHGFRSTLPTKCVCKGKTTSSGIEWRVETYNGSLELGLLVSRICRLSMSCSTSTSSSCLDINRSNCIFCAASNIAYNTLSFYKYQ